MMPVLPSKKHKKKKIHLGTAWPFAWGQGLGLKRFSLDLASFTTHMYIVGRSGKGKSKFLEGFLWQLVQHGQGCGLIDPHGDLADNLLKLLAFQPLDKSGRTWLSNPHNAARLVYVEPGHEAYFTPMNVLMGAESDYTIATNVIEAFKRTWSQELKAAPQFTNTALHGLLLLIEHGLSLVELPSLFLRKDFRDRLLAGSTNEDVKMFFAYRFGQWKNEQALRIESLLNKVTALTLNPSLRLMLGTAENRLNLRGFMDEGTILIVNLGKCDHETRNLLGSLLVVGLEQAALSRSNLPEQARRKWFCMIDEFQRFVANEGSAQALAEILSEARKFGLLLGLAHQGWHQFNNARLEGALDQAQIKVVFGSGSKTGRVIAEEMFSLDPLKVKHEGVNGNPYFESLLEQKEMFVQSIRRQGHREIFVLPPESDQVISLTTLDVPRPPVQPTEFEALVTRLLRQRALPVREYATGAHSALSNGSGRERELALGRVLQ